MAGAVDGVTAAGTVPPDDGRTGAHPKSRGAARRASRRGPTIDDVATVAGVSRGTVSRALNGGRYVSPAAQAAVRKAVRSTGYVVNSSARSLVTRRANAVAFVVSEPQERLFEDPNFDVLLRAATQCLAEHDIALVLMVAGDEDGRARVVRFVRGSHVDGVLLISTHGKDPLVAELVRHDLPLVMCGRPPDAAAAVPYAGAQDREGARQMTRYLLGTGRRTVGIITGPLDTPGGMDRLAGYRDVLGRRARKSLITSASQYSYAGGYDGMTALLEQSPGIDAVFVGSDLLAAGAIAALRRAGRRVPEDVAVGGFDDSRVALMTDPPLTTMRQPMERVAAEMVRLLLQCVAGEPAGSVLLPVELVRRGSA